MLLDERILRFIVTLGEELHFGRAAAKLYVSQPALSATVRGLERELGVELFQRNSRHVELTEAGRVLVEEGRTLMARADRVVTMVRESSTEFSGPLRIGYSPLINLQWLCSLVSRTRDEVDVSSKIEFVSAECSDAVRQLVAGKLHGALVMGHVCDPDTQSEALFKEQFMVAMSPKHFLANMADITFAHLQQEPVIWVRRDLNPFLYDSFLELCSAQQYEPNIIQEVTTIQECLQFAGEGLGITFIPMAARNIVSDATVLVKPIVETPLYIGTEFTYRRDSNFETLKPLVQLVRDHLPGNETTISLSD
jgi:DNA-binding transcriptional LysR family regulator